ncbi:F-box only protein 21-like [Oculina patagonica]
MEDEGESCSLLLLADELIDMVLSYSIIDHKDLCHCSQVCRRLNIIATGNELWKKKALSRWHFWRTKPKENWMVIYRDRILMEHKIHHALEIITKKYYTKAEVYKKELDRFVYLANENPALCCHVNDNLHELLQGDDCKVNLTHRHYARKVQSHLKIHQLKDEWKKFLALPEEQQHLEKGAMLIGRWILNEEDINENDTYLELDRIACIVQENLRGNSSSSSTNSTATAAPLEERMALSSEEFATVTHPTACLRILDCLKHVLYQQLQFKGNVNEYYKKDNSILHQVVRNRTGNPITLAVLFAAVARRLGVSLEPVNFPSHFLLRWRSSLDPQVDDSSAYKYIDCFGGGRFLTEEQCLDLLYGSMTSMGSSGNALFVKATPAQVFIRMVANIVNSYRTVEQPGSRLSGLHSSLDLALFLDPDDKDSRLLLARIQVHLGIDLEEAIDSLETLLATAVPIRRGIVENLLERANHKKVQQDLEDNLNNPPQPKLRSDPSHSQVGFKVGMVMRHKLYHYGCVIYGWDPVCKMDESWIQQMGVDRSPGGRNQPFYNVLGDDGSQRYAAHINLREDPNQPLNPHPELGKYFKGFTGSQYIPNECLQQQYPEDVDN